MRVVINELGEHVFYHTTAAFTGSGLDTYGLHYTDALSDIGRLATGIPLLSILVHNSSNISNVRLRSIIERYER